MAKQSVLELKREEAREEILAMNEKIPSALIFNYLGKAFPKNSFGYWLLNFLVLNLITLSPWLLIGLVLGELRLANWVYVGSIVTVEIVIMSLMVAHGTIQFLIKSVANRIAVKMTNTNDLLRITLWINQSWSIYKSSAAILPYALFYATLAVWGTSISIHRFTGFGFTITVLLVGTLGGILFHMVIWTCLLISSLKEYHYDINAFSPADSEVINDIYKMLTKAIFIVAVLSTIVNFVAAVTPSDEKSKLIFGVPLFVIFWLVIIVQFLLTRSTIAVVTDKAKWGTLNKIQVKINAIESKGDLSDKETSERLLRLADIHKRILTSKTQMFDLKSVSTLFSQLMLPLLGLLLGNLDKIRELLMK